MVRRRFPVPRIVDCDYNGSQVRTAAAAGAGAGAAGLFTGSSIGL